MVCTEKGILNHAINAPTVLCRCRILCCYFCRESGYNFIISREC